MPCSLLRNRQVSVEVCLKGSQLRNRLRHLFGVNLAHQGATPGTIVLGSSHVGLRGRVHPLGVIGLEDFQGDGAGAGDGVGLVQDVCGKRRKTIQGRGCTLPASGKPPTPCARRAEFG